MRKIAILLILALAACGPALSDAQRNEVVDIADGVSDNNDSALRSRLDEMEQRVSALERKP